MKKSYDTIKKETLPRGCTESLYTSNFSVFAFFLSFFWLAVRCGPKRKISSRHNQERHHGSDRKS